MKIHKFNEATEIKKYHICIVKNNADEIDYSGVFETKEDLENWLLNIINGILLDAIDSGQYYGRDEGEVFIDLVEAINWIQDWNDCNVLIDDDSMFYNNIKLKYGVETKRDVKKFNI